MYQRRPEKRAREKESGEKHQLDRRIRPPQLAVRNNLKKCTPVGRVLSIHRFRSHRKSGKFFINIGRSGTGEIKSKRFRCRRHFKTKLFSLLFIVRPEVGIKMKESRLVSQ
jgi:hypothetical protein